ncbi:protein NLRC3-like isoform X2 [Astyanax mexicanus]|uniref:Protein NLRC3-like isoform X2 n=1 Tax=Astyanax mexicanus TaxID=7994 RepID=A0A8T2MDQ2_ASTMX|nr:protein NLRC3-like isoform X2 [Astyanax mexicanus]
MSSSDEKEMDTERGRPVQRTISASSGSSSVSFKSDQSEDRPFQRKRSATSESSCVSMKSDQDDSPENRPVQRSASSESSCVSMKSDQSVGRIITFGDRPVQKKTCPSPEFSCLSMKSDQSVYRVITFSDDSTENRGVQREGSEITGRNMETSVQNLDYPSYPGDVPVGGDDTLHAFGDRMKQDDLATTSQTSKRSKSKF